MSTVSCTLRNIYFGVYLIKKFVQIDEVTENMTKVKSEIQKVSFICCTPYKTSKNSDIITYIKN